jgi:hypothetical protein
MRPISAWAYKGLTNKQIKDMKRYLLLSIVLFVGCSKPECNLLITEFTQQVGNDVYEQVRTFEASERPEDYVREGTKYVFVVDGSSCD